MDIGEQQLNAGSGCPHDLVGFESISRFNCLEARSAQEGGYRRSEDRFIVYDENGHLCDSSFKRCQSSPSGRVGLLLLVVSGRWRGPVKSNRAKLPVGDIGNYRPPRRPPANGAPTPSHTGPWKFGRIKPSCASGPRI